MSAAVQVDGQRLRLQGELNFAVAAALRAELASVIAASPGKPMTLDFSDIRRSNSVGLSLLLSAARTAREHQVDLQITGLPDGLQSMAAVCGLDDWLDTLSADPFSTKEIPDAGQ